MSGEKFYTTQAKAQTHDAMTPLLKAMYGEFKDLSKKKPDSAVSKGKIKIVNRLLEKVKVVLSNEESVVFLDLLDEDDIPQASDVTLIISQYVAAMDAFREKHYGWDGSTFDWFVR
jgi:hypothetical protein